MKPETIKLREVMNITNLSRSTIQRLERESKFPLGIRLTYNLKLWRVSEVQAWVADPANWKPSTSDERAAA